MSNAIITMFSQIGIVAILGFCGAVFFREQFNWRWFCFGLILYIVYEVLLIRGLYTIPRLFPDAAWNWDGKLLAMTGMLIIASILPSGWRRIGLTLHQGDKPWPAYAVTAGLAVFFFGVALLAGDGADDWETIAFQWTMPGFDEEIFYRGILLLAMNEAFTRKTSIFGAPIGYGGILVSVLFGIAHALSFGSQGFEFEVWTFLVTGPPALILLWLRERTGSLLLPIFAHNIANGIGTLI